jgi:tetratricopeptide (TPR) repeat protein
MRIALFVALLGLPVLTDAAQAQRPNGQAQAQANDPIAEAYRQFLRAKQLEADQDTDGAIDAYKRAMTLDPTAADLPASLAALYVETNRLPDAIASAETALKLDASNTDAHRALGTAYATMATAETRTPRQTRQEHLGKAIEHLQKAAERPGLPADVNLRAMLARVYVLHGSYDKAIPLLAELVRQEPGWQDGPGLLVDAFASAGRTNDAIAWLEEHAPETPTLYATLADVFGREERWNEAGRAYERALEASPRNVDLRVRYATMLMNASGAEAAVKARTVLREAVAMRGTDERALYLLSQAERRAHDLDASEKTARRLIAQNGRNPRGYFALAEALEERQRYSDVVDALGPVVPTFRSGKASEFALGLILPHLGFAYQQLGRHEEAIATFEEAQKIAPKDLSIKGFLIQAHVSAKRYGPALELARAARASNPDELRFARLEADVLRQSGKGDQALAVLEDVLRKRGDDPAAHLALAHGYVEASRGAQAVKVLQEAQLKFPADVTLPFELGAVFEKQKKYVDAEAAFKQALQRNPEHAPTLNYLGYMLADRGERLSESVDYIKRALAIEPANGSYLDSLGWAYFKNGQLQLAEEHLRRAAEQLILNAVVQDHYGDVLIRLGRVQDAIDAWGRALSGDTEDLDRSVIDRKVRSAKQKLPKQ